MFKTSIMFYLFFNLFTYFMLYIQRRAKILSLKPIPKHIRFLIPLTQFNLVSMIYITNFYLERYCTIKLESSLNIIKKLGICVAVGQVWFYFIHILLHKFYYKKIHSIHHKWVNPDPRSTLYCHPVENILCNVGSLILPIMTANTSQKLSLLWCFITSVMSILSHSGSIRGKINSHEYHHKFVNKNFGSGKIMDIVFNTNKKM